VWVCEEGGGGIKNVWTPQCITKRDTVVWLTRNELLEENTSRALFCYYCDYGFVLLLEEEEENDDEEDEDEDEDEEEGADEEQ